MSIRSNSGSPPSTSCARTIMPAHVPRIGIPAAARSRTGSIRSYARASLPIVVDSPPGIARQSTSASCAGVRTSTGVAPSAAKAFACSRKSPCKASTPAFIALPAAVLQARLERADLQALHRVADGAGDPPGHVGLREVGRRLDDRPGHHGRVLGLEDARADEHAVDAE